MAMAALCRRLAGGGDGKSRNMVTLAKQGIQISDATKKLGLSRLVGIYSKKKTVNPTECASTAENLSALMLFYLKNGMSRRHLPEALRSNPAVARIIYDSHKFDQIMCLIREVASEDEASVRRIIRIVPQVFGREPTEIKRTVQSLQHLGVDKSFIVKYPAYLCMEDLEKKAKLLAEYGVTEKGFGKVLKKWKGASGLSLDMLKIKLRFLADFSIVGKNLERVLVKYPWLLKEDNMTMEECFPLFKKFGVEGLTFARMVAWYPGSLKAAESLSTREEVLVKAGLEKGSLIYKSALAVSALTRADILEERISRYASYGFSVTEVQEMFRKQPRILRISDKFLKLKMRFLLDCVKLPRERLIKSPNYLLYSLDKRLRPRFHAAAQALQDGLPQFEIGWKSVFYSRDDHFKVMVKSWELQHSKGAKPESVDDISLEN